MNRVRSLKVPGVICFILATVWIVGWERSLTSGEHRFYPPRPEVSKVELRMEEDALGMVDGE
jgi:hypothetical protein